MKAETIIEEDKEEFDYNQYLERVKELTGGKEMKCGTFCIDQKESLKTDAPDGEYPIIEKAYYYDFTVKTESLVKVKEGYIDVSSLIDATDEWMLRAKQDHKSPSDHTYLEGAWYDAKKKSIRICFGS